MFHVGAEFCRRFDIILSGTVLIEHSDEDDKQLAIGWLTLAICCLAVSFFWKQAVYPMTVIAQEPSHILQIKKDRLVELLITNRAFLLSYLAYVSDNTLILGERIKHFN